MATFKRFEDIDAWQKARELCLNLRPVLETLLIAKDFDLKSQMSRASGSIMDNIAEGFERGGRKEFIQFLSIAKGSAGEVRSQLQRAKDYEYITVIEFENLYKQTADIGSIIAGLIKYLQNSEIKGVKYITEHQH